MTEKLLITGGSGFLGSNIIRMAAKDFEVYATYNSHPSKTRGCKFVPLDIRDKQRVLSTFEEIKPTLVIHTAALADVDYCEGHANEARMTNVRGTENMALAAKRVGAKMIYISTDSVFDGKKGMYVEEDTSCPLNVYAITKLGGEEKVQHWLPDGIIVRTAFYGWGSSNKASLAEWVVSSLRQGKTIKMFTDVFFSPIFIDNLVEAMIELYRNGIHGIYHVGGRERCSKYTFGQEITQAYGLDKSLIQPSSITEVGLRAPRPKDISLDITKISGVINTRLLNAQEGITRFKNLEHSAKEKMG